MAQARITVALKETLTANPKIQTVYFTEDGHHHFNAYYLRDHNPKFKGENTRYTQLQEIPEKVNNIYTGKHIMVPFKTAAGADDPRYVVVAEMTREAVLNAPVNVSSLEVSSEQQKTVERLFTREQLLAEMGITPATIEFMKQLQAEKEAAIAKGEELDPEPKPAKKK